MKCATAAARVRETGAVMLAFLLCGAARAQSAGGWRSSEQLWRSTRDPIGIFEKVLLDNGLATQSEFDENDARVVQISEDAAEFAANSPDPSLDELYTDVMVDNSTALTYRYERK